MNNNKTAAQAAEDEAKYTELWSRLGVSPDHFTMMFENLQSFGDPPPKEVLSRAADPEDFIKWAEQHQAKAFIVAKRKHYNTYGASLAYSKLIEKYLRSTTAFAANP